MAMITAKQLSQIKGVQLQTIYNWVKNGCPHDYALKGKKMILNFDKREVELWLLGRK